MSDPATTPAEKPADDLHPTEKPAFKSSEFWLAVLVVTFAGIAMLIQTWQGKPIDMGPMVAAGMASVGFSGARAFTKSNAPL